MSAIKLHLPQEERAALIRVADRLNLKPEDILYVALDRLMLQLNDPLVREEIKQTAVDRSAALARWSDTAHSVHIYESQADDESRPSGYLRIEEWF